MSENEEPQWLTELKASTPPEWLELLEDPSGVVVLSDELPQTFPAERVAEYGTDERKTWETIGLFYRAQNRWYDAIAIYASMYKHFLEYQLESGSRVHKGMPLVWIADSYLSLGNIPLSKRYLMLTLIEDAITYGGDVDPKKTGSYFRMAWRHGLSDIEIQKYSRRAAQVAEQCADDARFPEFVLQELDKAWMVEVPSPNDSGIYVANTTYINYLLKRLGDPQGKTLERLADYVMSAIPGCGTARRVRSHSTDYDIVCSIEGPAIDFRSDFGRYFVCECKDWEDPVDFTSFAKFARVLDSVKARVGVIFSKDGISGEEATKYAAREQLKVYQDRGMVIMVMDLEDLNFIAQGGNLVARLREKYERVRLDLS